MSNTKGFTHESTHNESKEWYTPKYIFDALGIQFDLDPCSPGAAVVPWVPARRHISLPENGLTAHWEGKIWGNPPYGSDTPKWLEHLSVVGNGIALVFARTDTKWFHKYVPKANAVCFVQGRIQFGPAKKDKINYPALYAAGKYEPAGGCGAGSMLIAYGPNMAKALFRSGLGLTLPITKNVETFRATKDFAGGGRRPNENLPRISERRQSIINAASARLRNRK